jgi:hypothetical protein
MFLDLTGRICESVADDGFRNVMQLSQDFRAGRFAAAFPQQPEAETRWGGMRF